MRQHTEILSGNIKLFLNSVAVVHIKIFYSVHPTVETSKHPLRPVDLIPKVDSNPPSNASSRAFVPLEKAESTFERRTNTLSRGKAENPSCNVQGRRQNISEKMSNL